MIQPLVVMCRPDLTEFKISKSEEICPIFIPTHSFFSLKIEYSSGQSESMPIPMSPISKVFILATSFRGVLGTKDGILITSLCSKPK